MRMSNVAMNRSSVNIVNSTAIKYDKVIIQSTSGMKIQKGHEDPVLAHKALQLENIKANNTQLARNAEDAKSFINYTETTLGQVADLVTTVKELMIRASSDTINNESRDALVQQVNQIILEVANIGNQQFNGKYIFAGTNTTTKPYEVVGDPPTAIKCFANKGDISFNVDTSLVMKANVSGVDVFDNLLKDLIGVRDAIHDNSLDAVTTNLFAKIENHLDNIISKRTELGAKVNILDATLSRISTSDYETESTYSSLMGVDLTKTSVEMASLQVSYQAGLSMIAKLHQLNLMDYVK